MLSEARTALKRYGHFNKFCTVMVTTNFSFYHACYMASRFHFNSFSGNQFLISTVTFLLVYMLILDKEFKMLILIINNDITRRNTNSCYQ